MSFKGYSAKNRCWWLYATTAVFFVLVSDLCAWTLTTEKGIADDSDRMPNKVQTNNGIDSGRSTVTRENSPQTPIVLPKIISPAELPVGMAVDLGNGDYLTSEGVYKKLDNGAYLTPKGLMIHTENGALIHLPSGLPSANQ
jgi:hypothetical protein